MALCLIEWSRPKDVATPFYFVCCTSPTWLVAHALSPTTRVFPVVAHHSGFHHTPHNTHHTTHNIHNINAVPHCCTPQESASGRGHETHLGCLQEDSAVAYIPSHN